MRMESPEQKNILLSEVEHEKAMELSKTIEGIYKFVNNTNDSNVAEEMKNSMNSIINLLKENGSRPSDFYLWNLFILRGETESVAEYKKFDTENGDIEKFIQELEKLNIENQE
jgi:hypothetical protein